MIVPGKALLVTGLGMTTNLGTGAAMVAAAQRAGVIRRTELADYLTFADGPDMEAPVIGAPVTGLTDGFMQPGLWLRLAVAALEDLLEQGQLPAADDVAFWRHTGLHWVLPEISFERFLWNEADVPAILEETCLRPLLKLTGLPMAPQDMRFLPAGAAATATATHAFLHDRTSGGPERMVVLSTDSWLDPLSMRSLIGANRIKSPEQPVGLCPGESGVAVLLEHPQAATRRSVAGQARILAAAVQGAPWPADDEPMKARVAGAPEAARRLSAVIHQVLHAGGIPLPFTGALIVDLNGEEWRAHVWGFTQTLLMDAVDLGRATLVVPAVEFGDTGASFSALGIGLAARSFARGYAPADYSLVCSVSEAGTASAILLATPSPS